MFLRNLLITLFLLLLHSQLFALQIANDSFSNNSTDGWTGGNNSTWHNDGWMYFYNGTTTKTYDFGVAKAGRTVTISYHLYVPYTNYNGYGNTSVEFFVNGVSKKSYTEGDYYKKDSYTTTLDSTGKISLSFAQYNTYYYAAALNYVTIDLINSPPIVDAGPDKNTTINTAISLTGTATDSDGSIVSYEWSDASGTVLATTASFNYTPSVAGIFTLTFKATDDSGDTSTDTMQLTVEAAPDIHDAYFTVLNTAPDATEVGTVTSSAGTPTSYSIVSGNADNIFSIDSTGRITVSNIASATLKTYKLIIKASNALGSDTATITIALIKDTVYENKLLPFDLINPKETRNIIGNTQIIGNTVECVTSYTGSYSNRPGSLTDLHNAQCDNNLDHNDNNYFVKYVDIDSDSSTKNSSNANVNLPATYKEVAWAGLFWQGHYNDDSYQYYSGGWHFSSDYTQQTDNNFANYSANFIKMKIDNATYTTIQAEKLNYLARGKTAIIYSAYADVTQQLIDANITNSTNITIADIVTTEGLESSLGNYGAWALVIVYKEDETNPSSKLRNNSVYLGYEQVSSDNSTDNKAVKIPINNFLLPKRGTIDSQVAVFAAEGEYAYSWDTMSLDSTSLGADNCTKNKNDPSCKTNMFDAKLSPSITRNPSLTNNNGIDIDVFDSSSIMTQKRDNNPNATSYSSTIRLKSNQDLYLPSMVSFTTELYKPRVCYYIDTITDTNNNIVFENGAFTSKIQPDTDYTYNIFISNMKKSANDTDIEIANKVQVYMNMKDFTYKSNSTKINNIDGVNTATLRSYQNLSDSVDNDLGEYDSSTTSSTWRVGAGATASSGGTLDVAGGFSDTKNISYLSFKGALKAKSDATQINLLDYLEFKASFQTDTITIGEANAQIIAQCQDLNATASLAGAPGGYFNVVTTAKRSSVIANGFDPLSNVDSPLNALPTQVSNRAMPVSIIALASDKTTPQKYKGLIALELIEQPNYLDSDSEAAKKDKCSNAPSLSGLTSYVFPQQGGGTTYLDISSFSYPKANKNAAFRIKYLKQAYTDGAVSGTCTQNSFNCIWGMLVSEYGNNDSTPCKNVCKPGGGTGNNQASTACIECVFGGSVSGSACSRDNFAVRPNQFTLTAPVGEDIDLLRSGHTYSIGIVAQQSGNTSPTMNYNVSNANTQLNIDDNKTIYAPDGTIPTPPLSGTLSFGSPFNFVDGSATGGIKFDNVGKVQIKLIDTTWAKVDIDHGDTTADCSASGAYVCGDLNATFIPHHFNLTNVHLKNNQAHSYTYLSNDLNMSAGFDVTLAAANEANATTTNFDINTWENPVDVNITLPTITGKTPIKSEIATTSKISFTNGVKTIHYNDTNSSANLRFNFDRNATTPQNPFQVQGVDTTLTASSKYTASSGATATIQGSNVADQNATFLYGRAHAGKQHFEVPNDNPYTADIYYESYCFDTGCDTSLLPTPLKHTNDIRWYQNPSHVPANDGNASSVSNPTGIVIPGSVAQSTHTAVVPLPYNGNNGYPYVTTMEINASSWLMYQKNPFQAEYNNGASDWNGVRETSTATKAPVNSKTSRRTLW